MRTQETFYKPGLEEPAVIIENLAPVPRELHLVNQRLSVLWRLFVLLFSILVVFVLEMILLDSYIQTASLLSLVLVVSILLLPFTVLPWWLITTYRQQILSYRHCEKIYREGIPCIGTINTMTRMTGNNHHFFAHRNHPSPMVKIRVDYTFSVEDEIKTGTVVLPETSVDYLQMNDEICVLYLGDNPSDNMIFPLPGNDFFTIFHHHPDQR